MTARNRRAVERSLRERAEIRRVWLELVQRWPFERHTAKDIGRQLHGLRLSDNAVRWHMRAIQAEAAADIR